MVHEFVGPSSFIFIVPAGKRARDIQPWRFGPGYRAIATPPQPWPLDPERLVLELRKEDRKVDFKMNRR